MALLHVDPERSKQELSSMLRAAQPDGFIPHMVLWERAFHEAALEQYSIVLADPFFTATIQPPVIARALWRVYEVTSELDFVREALPAVVRFFDWLAAVRDPDGDGLIAIIQPDESGLDASPKYDDAMGFGGLDPSRLSTELPRGMERLFAAYAPFRREPKMLPKLDVFNWVDVMVNSIYADGLDCLARLNRVAGVPEGEAKQLEQRANVTAHALLERCWDERTGVFWDLQGADRQPVRVLTFSVLFPLIIASMDQDVVRRLVEEHFLNEHEF